MWYAYMLTADDCLIAKYDGLKGKVTAALENDGTSFFNCGSDLSIQAIIIFYQHKIQLSAFRHFTYQEDCSAPCPMSDTTLKFTPCSFLNGVHHAHCQTVRRLADTMSNSIPHAQQQQHHVDSRYLSTRGNAV